MEDKRTKLMDMQKEIYCLQSEITDLENKLENIKKRSIELYIENEEELNGEKT